jgi:peroxisomal 3,2-trans-enoyl-CoA isomerase
VAVLTGRGKYYTSGQELQEPDLSPEGAENNKKRRLVTKYIVQNYHFLYIHVLKIHVI